MDMFNFKGKMIIMTWVGYVAWPRRQLRLVLLLILSGVCCRAEVSTAQRLYPPECTTHSNNVRYLLEADETMLAEKFSNIPTHCQADAVAQSLLDAESNHRPDQVERLRALALTKVEVACDPAVYYAAGQIHLGRGQLQLAACFYDKAMGIANNSQVKERLRREYAKVAKSLPDAPLDQLQCSRLLGQQIKQVCEGKRGVVVDDALPGTAALKIHFDTNQDTMQPDGTLAVRQLADSLQNGSGGTQVAKLNRELGITRIQPTSTAASAAIPIRSIHLIGHADARGDENYNMDLSIRRAETVRQALATALPGVAITSEGRGKRELLYPDAQIDAEHQLNRRVEILVK